MNRRNFLATVSQGALGGLSLTHLAQAKGKNAQRRLTKIGLQLYTLRNEMQKDFHGTLAKVASIGFKEVEFAGYFNQSPEQVKTVLSRNGLTAPAVHVPTASIRENLQKTIDIAHIIGHQYLICPFLSPQERKSLDDYKRLAELFNRAGAACQKAGLQFGYHNHDFEFEVLEGQLPYDVLLKETDPKLVKMELDLYWITRAQQSPAKYFARYPGRFPLFHVKDMDQTPKRFFTEVGRGVINFKQIFAQANKAGVKHFFVEQDQTPGNPFESIQISYNYLKQLRY